MKSNKNTLVGGGVLIGAAALTYFYFNDKKSTPPLKVVYNKSKLTNSDKLAFINKVLPSAIEIGNKIGVPPMFIVAQIALESGWGKSTLTTLYNNFGGIKAFGNQPSVSMLTTECKNGTCFKVYQNFAKYPSVKDGLWAQAKIYTNNYFKQHLNKTKDPLTYAKLIQSGKIRYATALNYPKAIEATLNEINRLKAA